ncbi:hypothetical protein NP233_g10191 [Leucocoprinus birnbaumii]|uniref:Large ribosomal subunit protein uL30m n=1 Tax=Leucocoprinus birnbaumii TaxID=56174 RepID=A0AAD5VJ11_9AGAR|nr:hypothetical protein NP233_g10191 [Leucocoprinus birnbaumii]
MSSLPICRRALLSRNFTRTLSTASLSTPALPANQSPSSPPSTDDTRSPSSEPLTHFRVTLRRSGISLGEKVRGTIEALGFHKRNQIVYHRHSSDIAGKILKIKELVEVKNVPESAVRNKWEQRQERKAVRGYKVIGNKADNFMRI